MLKAISIDDNRSMAQHIQGMLHSLNPVFYSGHAVTLDEAYMLIEKESPEVIFLDINLKEESGLDVLCYLKKSQSDATVIVLTNHSESFYKSKCRSLGANYFLDKSYEFDKIPEIINQIVTKRQT